MNSEEANSCWIDHYRKHGYVVLEKILSLELIDAHVAACKEIQRRHGIYQNFPWRKDPLENEKAFGEELLALNDNHEPTKSLRNDPTLRQYLNALFQEEAVLKYGSTSLWERGREPHSDTVMLFRDPPEKVCRTWCALEDIDPDWGMFYVIPGTHNNERLCIYDEVLGSNPEIFDLLRSPSLNDSESAFLENRAIWKVVCKKTISLTQGLPRVPFSINKGDVVLFDPNVIHGTMPAPNPSLTRKAIITEWHTHSVRSYSYSEYFGSQHDKRQLSPAN
ncbi:phytanoyl-CoA dioxygenase family protein [Nostoc sp.]|uniref:phytanoyl-CoA dioxygenase family protein n=1 Tax=Nostoc sp. TaxID=1180 RepID=UPI002FF62D0B